MRLISAIGLAVLSLVFIGASVSSYPLLSAQELFNTKSLPRDQMSPPEPLRPRLKALAGGNALNCGRGNQTSLKAADVSDCALEAYVSKKRFYARFDLEGGFDVDLGVGFASDGEKAYVITSWRPIAWDSARLEVHPCPLPTKLVKTRSGRLDCFSADPSSRPKLLENY